VSFVELVP
jgi:hypothetical protein